MLINFIYFLLAALGLSFLVFIHELGHYFMAKRVGMRVQVFSIGFGKPFISWKRGDVKWQVCFLLFGGYVKIAGMDKENGKEPYEIKDGFFAKNPWDRIKVALAGPVVNIVFALCVFTMIWAFGGREKPFSEFTNVIGFVDPSSELYQKGVRPGDQIVSLNNHEFRGFKDLLYTSVLNKKKINIQGDKIDYFSHEKTPFYYSLIPYQYPGALSKDFKTIGIIRPATFLIYDKVEGLDNQLAEGSPMYGSGLSYGDRIVWADGELIFSHDQLSSLINSSLTLLTVKRGEEIFLAKIPRIKIQDLKLTPQAVAELEDWQHEAGLKGSVKDYQFIPYELSMDNKVVKPLYFMGEDLLRHNIFDKVEPDLYRTLEEGDQILQIDGMGVSNGYALFNLLQEKHVQIIVQQMNSERKNVSWKHENQDFIYSINTKDLSTMVASIMRGDRIEKVNNLKALKPIQPMSLGKVSLGQGKKSIFAIQYQDQIKGIEKIKDPVKREKALEMLEKMRKKKVLGISLVDKKVIYNPNPFSLFSQVLTDTWRTLSSLVSGKLKPKWISGPIGMVQALHHGWSLGFKEAFFWIGMISLNLGVFNLLPLPVLDGGHICLSIYEWVTRKRISAKAMEKLIIPFVVLLVALFVYVTYQDILRIFQRFF